MGERRKTLYYTYQLAKRRDLILWWNRKNNCSYSHSCRNAFDGWWRICCFFFNSTWKSKAENVRDTTDQDYEKGLTEEQKAFNELINKQIYEETANNLEQYEQYGLTYNSDENQLFFNGKSVCYFADNRATDGTFEGTEVHSANGDIGIITERDRNGNITGLKQMEIPELTDFLEKSWKEK